MPLSAELLDCPPSQSSYSLPLCRTRPLNRPKQPPAIRRPSICICIKPPSLTGMFFLPGFTPTQYHDRDLSPLNGSNAKDGSDSGKLKSQNRSFAHARHPFPPPQRTARPRSSTIPVSHDCFQICPKCESKRGPNKLERGLKACCKVQKLPLHQCFSSCLFAWPHEP